MLEHADAGETAGFLEAQQQYDLTGIAASPHGFQQVSGASLIVADQPSRRQTLLVVRPGDVLACRDLGDCIAPDALLVVIDARLGEPVCGAEAQRDDDGNNGHAR